MCTFDVVAMAVSTNVRDVSRNWVRADDIDDW